MKNKSISYQCENKKCIINAMNQEKQKLHPDVEMFPFHCHLLIMDDDDRLLQEAIYFDYIIEQIFKRRYMYMYYDSINKEKKNNEF